MPTIKHSPQILRWFAGGSAILAYSLSMTSGWISVPFSRTAFALIVFGLAAVGCVLMYLAHRTASRPERRQQLIHLVFFLSVVLLPMKEDVPSMLRFVCIACAIAALVGLAYTYYRQKHFVREEQRT